MTDFDQLSEQELRAKLVQLFNQVARNQQLLQQTVEIIVDLEKIKAAIRRKKRLRNFDI